jgi:uncharacterized HAD superfamily protein
VDIPSALFKRDYVVGSGKLTLEQYRELQRTVYGTREIGLLMEPIEGVLDYLPRLIADGHSILVITSRGETELEIANEWAASHGLVFDSVSVGYTERQTKAEAAAGLDVFVDDDLDKLVPLHSIVPHLFLFNWGYNQHIDEGNIAQRVSSWEELYNAIQTLKDSR